MGYHNGPPYREKIVRMGSKQDSSIKTEKNEQKAWLHIICLISPIFTSYFNQFLVRIVINVYMNYRAWELFLSLSLDHKQSSRLIISAYQVKQELLLLSLCQETAEFPVSCRRSLSLNFAEWGLKIRNLHQT